MVADGTACASWSGKDRAGEQNEADRRRALQGLLSLKDQISSALQAIPQAALAWTGVCFAMQVGLSARLQRQGYANVQGIHKPDHRDEGKSGWHRSRHLQNEVVL